MDTTSSTEAATAADIIRSATAWWNLAADALEAGDHARARDYAYLGRFGLDGMGERIATLTAGGTS